MFTLLFLAMVALLFTTASSDTFSQMQKMSLNFGTANKPYEPQNPKPKKPKFSEFQHLMARGKYAGTGLIGLSGKIAGTVFLSNNVVRVWRKPNNVRNAFTQLVRGIFSGTSSAWKTLTSSEVASWIGAAPLYFSKAVFATTYALKGNTLFQRVNNTLTSLGLPNITTAPGLATPAFVATVATAAASVGGGTFGITITEFNGAIVLPANSYIKVYATPQVDIGQSSFSPSRYRLIGTFPPTTSTNPLSIFADYVARFGGLVLGQRIGLSFAVVTYNPAGGGSFHESGRFSIDAIVAA